MSASAAATCAEAVLEFDGAAAAAVAAAAGGAAAAAAGPLRLYVRAQVVMLGGAETLLVRATEMVDAADLPPPGAEGEATGGPTGAAALDRFGRIWQKAWEQGGTKVKVRAAHVLEVLQKGEVKVTHVEDDACDLELGAGNTRTLKALKVANTSGTGSASPAPAELRLYEQLRAVQAPKSRLNRAVRVIPQHNPGQCMAVDAQDGLIVQDIDLADAKQLFEFVPVRVSCRALTVTLRHVSSGRVVQVKGDYKKDNACRALLTHSDGTRFICRGASDICLGGQKEVWQIFAWDRQGRCLDVHGYGTKVVLHDWLWGQNQLWELSG